MIVVLPAFKALTTPLGLMVATVLSLLVHEPPIVKLDNTEVLLTVAERVPVIAVSVGNGFILMVITALLLSHPSDVSF